MKNLHLKAEPLGDSVPRNPRIFVNGTGPDAYLWIGSDSGFVGIARNTAETRQFLRRALARLEKVGKSRRAPK